MRADQERVKTLLTEAITLLCRNSLQYKDIISIEGLIAVTLDEKDILLVNINESIKSHISSSDSSCENNANDTVSQKMYEDESNEEVETFPLIQPKIEPTDSSSLIDNVGPEFNHTIKLEKIEPSEEKEISKTILSVSSNTSKGSPCKNFDVKTVREHNFQNTSTTYNSPINTSNNTHIDETGNSSFFVIDSDEEDLTNDSNDDACDANTSYDPSYDLFRRKRKYCQSDEFKDMYFSNDNPSDSTEMGWANFGNEQEKQIAFEALFSEDNTSQNQNQISPKQCPICFKTVSVVKSHMMSVHLNLKNHVCKICGKRFGAAITLSRHIVRIHTNIRAFKCPGCDHRCKVKWDLKVHFRTCIQCKSKGITIDDLESYLQSMKDKSNL